MSRALCRAGTAAALALLCACHDGVSGPTATPAIVGSGVIASQARPVSGFAAVTVSGPIRLVLQESGSESLVVTTDDNVIAVVQSEVRDGRLFLGFVPDTSLTRTSEIVCRVTMREVREVAASGAARLELSGIDSTRLAITLSGATTASAGGVAEELLLEVSGASRWTAGDLHSRAVTASVSGASYGLVRASHALVASVSGASVLEYFGDPDVVRVVDGFSVVRRVGP
jgi:hypothetical protein